MPRLHPKKQDAKVAYPLFSNFFYKTYLLKKTIVFSVRSLPELDRRFYVNPWIRFDVYKSGWVIMHYEGEEIKRHRLKRTWNKDIMAAFEDELGPLATGSPIPMPSLKPTTVEKKSVEELEEKLKKLTKRVDRLLEKLGEKEI